MDLLLFLDIPSMHFAKIHNHGYLINVVFLQICCSNIAEMLFSGESFDLGFLLILAFH